MFDYEDLRNQQMIEERIEYENFFFSNDQVLERKEMSLTSCVEESL